ncbi:N-6 DNA methylase [Peristeroidobacter soli]|uniref:N-6 DNA methylase n=1 Tax=Peristeroidobacter soli TaxID=2497877 RepID=UPI00158F44C0|nr:N-6 DNA methylase [Peristeroidobacter soli]
MVDTLDHLGAAWFADELARVWIPLHRQTQVLSPELSDLILRIARSVQKTDVVTFLGASSEAVAVAATRRGVAPKLVSPNQATLTLICALLRDVQAQVQERHPFEQPYESPLDRTTPTIAIPTRLGRIEADHEARYAARSALGAATDEALYVEHVLRHTTGVAIVLVSARLLFSRGPEAELRRALVESSRLKAVISFPAGLLEPNYVPFALLLLDKKQSDNHTVFCTGDPYVGKDPGKQRTTPRRFVNQSQLLANIQQPTSPLSRKVSSAEIASRDYDLTVRKYVSTQAQEALDKAAGSRPRMPLGELVEIIKPQALPSPSDDDGIEVGEMNPAELPIHGFVTRGARMRYVDAKSLRRNARQILNRGDLLLAVKGVIGPSAVATPETTTVPSQAFVILRLRQTSPIERPIALLMYLRSPLFQSLLQSAVTGTTIPNISLADLGQLPVIIPTREQQQHLHLLFEHQAQLQEQINELRQRQNDAAVETWNSLGLSPEDLRT